LISSAVADTYNAAQARDNRALVERRLRTADVIFWLQNSFGDGVFALLVQSNYKDM